MSKHRFVAGLALAALALGTIVSPAAAAGTTRWVDDDGTAGPAGCKGSHSAATHVQAAIDASGKNDTVLVCPGTYPEALVIGPAKDGLTLRSVRPWKAKLSQPASLDNPSRMVWVRGDGVTVQQLVIVAHAPGFQTAGPGSCGLTAAIQVTALDARILANRIRATGDTWGPCGYRSGIVVGALGPVGGSSEPVASALVSHNLVRDFLDFGVLVQGDGVSATVERNSIRYWHLDAELNSVQAARLTASRSAAAWHRSGPAGPGSIGIGIGVGFEGEGIVYGNEVSSGPNAVFLADEPITPALYIGIAGNQPDALEIRGNTVRRASFGIDLYRVNNALVRGNVSAGHYVGINVTESDFNAIRSNQAGPGIYGIVLQSGLTAGFGTDSNNNRITDNTALGNVELDCDDNTTGPYTDGTANTWRRNVGLNDDPSGLCQID